MKDMSHRIRNTVWTTRYNLRDADRAANRKLYSFNHNELLRPTAKDLLELPVVNFSPHGAFVWVDSPPDFGPPHRIKLKHAWDDNFLLWGIFWYTREDALKAIKANEEQTREFNKRLELMKRPQLRPATIDITRENCIPKATIERMFDVETAAGYVQMTTEYAALLRKEEEDDYPWIDCPEIWPWEAEEPLLSLPDEYLFF